MSKLDKMIKELCPDGMEYVKLGELCTFVRGKTITEKDTIEGNIPVIAGGQKPSYFHNEHNKDGESITVAGSGAYAGFVSFWNVPIWVSDAFTVEPNDKAITKYVYYFLLTKQQRIFETQKGAGVPHVHGKDIANFEIPLPPLPIQQKIVSVLDSFTTLIDKMKQEVEKRKKQMEYYREKLLTFEDGECERKTLGDLFVIKNGLNKEKDAFGHGTPIINYTDVYKKRCLYSSDVKGLVELSSTEISRYECKKGDVFFTRTSETKEEVGFPSVLLDDIENCTFSGFVLRARPLTDDLLPEYCKYCFFTFAFRKEVIKRATLTTRALTNGGSLSKISIPIPDKDKQSEIVSTLDKFESYITKLEKMIVLRQKQYEYYREQLLTFR